MNDVRDYLRRAFFAAFFCPAATGFWIVFAWAGFSFDGFLALMGTISQQYAAMNMDEQWAFRFEVLASWGVLAFGFFFLNYVTRPPQFSYKLKKEGDHWVTDIVKQ